MKYLIFTDLDGTLLDHFTYSFKEAIPCIDIIKTKNIPLAFITSKTKVEVEKIISQVDYDIVFSVENGAAVYFFDKLKIHNKVFGEKLEKIIQFYEKVKKRYNLLSVFEISEEKLSEMVNLSVEKIRLLKEREFSVPFIIKVNNNLQQLEAEAASSGFKILKGGRFYHLVSKNQDKGVALNYIKNILGKNCKCIGLGDSGNDYDLLSNVDIPIIIKKYDDSYDEKLLDIKGAIKSRFVGPKGWCDSLIKFLKEENGG
ncbi:HAD-IIB family hydrolase [Deferribacteraceae bacterium V6Fe1]|nr:HAD-IIB family hydrolase [Deferribacteraceae bacterium V6Fe1]